MWSDVKLSVANGDFQYLQSDEYWRQEEPIIQGSEHYIWGSLEFFWISEEEFRELILYFRWLLYSEDILTKNTKYIYKNS